MTIEIPPRRVLHDASPELYRAVVLLLDWMETDGCDGCRCEEGSDDLCAPCYARMALGLTEGKS